MEIKRRKHRSHNHYNLRESLGWFPTWFTKPPNPVKVDAQQTSQAEIRQANQLVVESSNMDK